MVRLYAAEAAKRLASIFRRKEEALEAEEATGDAERWVMLQIAYAP